MVNRIDSTIQIKDLTVTDDLNLPAGSVTNAMWATAAADRLVAEKVEHQKTIIWTTATTSTTLAAVTRNIFVSNSTGTIEAMYVRPETAPTGNYAFTVDIKKATDGSTSYSTILSGVVTCNSSSTDGTLQSGTLSTTTFAANDALEIVVAVSGSSGVQGAGATVGLVIHELPE